MPNITPVSELRNYGQVLEKVKPSSPVYLTKNGHGVYSLHSIEDDEEFEKAKAMDADGNGEVTRSEIEAYQKAQDEKKAAEERSKKQNEVFDRLVRGSRSAEKAITEATLWYKAHYSNKDMVNYTQKQIEDFVNAARAKNLQWSR